MRNKIVNFVTSTAAARKRGRSQLATSVMLQCGDQYASLHYLTVLFNSFGGLDDNLFIPMLEKAHKWCAAYCFNLEKIWVKYSVSTRPLEEHSAIDKLNVVVDKFFSSFDKAWVYDQLKTWQRKVVKVERQEDGCGVYMLSAIKTCAKRYREEYALVRFPFYYQLNIYT